MIRKAVALTVEAFAPYGTVIEHRGKERRFPVEGVFEAEATVTTSRVWVTRATDAGAWPIVIRQMERHPYSAQTFIPLRGQPYLVAVCPAQADGMPDASRLEAFVANPHQGVIYRKNTWHHGLTVLGESAEYVVLQMPAANGKDDVFMTLGEPVTIEPGV